MMEQLQAYTTRLEELARRLGLAYDPVAFELVPSSFMTEVAVYGLPVRIPHWSFGVRYVYQLVQHRMGRSRLFEVVFPGNPSRAYLANTNSLAENTLVVAHVLGHADFSTNNLLFRRSQAQVSDQIVERAATQARQIADAVEAYGQQRVEAVLDAALALEQHIDVHEDVQRPRYPGHVAGEPPVADDFLDRYRRLAADAPPAAPAPRRRRLPVPPRREYDLLWFIAHYAPELEGWERDVFLAVRRESYYFYPVFACQIMNEGWASYWHARLLREADFLPSHLYIDALKAHSDVVRPYAGEGQVALAINPYHVGFRMWERIIERHGLAHARQLMQQEDDFSFIRNNLDAELAEELDLFAYSVDETAAVTVDARDVEAVREAILAPKFHFGAPHVYVEELATDGTLVLRHDAVTDGRGLDLTRAQKVLEYVHRVWRRCVMLHTLDAEGEETTLVVESQEAA